MRDYDVVEIKAFIPAKDFELSKRFYGDIGFDMKWSSDALAYFAVGQSSFLLQNFYVKEHAENFMMHLMVKSADDWWARLKETNVAEHYTVSIGEPEDRDWGMRDFTLIDPSRVLWRIGNLI